MEEKNTKPIWDLFNRLGPISNHHYSDIVKLLFIKYIAKYPDEFMHNMNSADSLKTLLEFTRKYDAARSGDNCLTKEDLGAALRSIDTGLSNIQSDVKLYDIVEDIPYFFDQRTQSMVIGLLDNIVIDNNRENWKTLLEHLLNYSQMMLGKFSDEASTPFSVRDIAYNLLNISNYEKVLNCYCGYSSFLLGDIKPSKYIGYDTNSNTALVSLITSIFLKVESEIYNKDFLYANTHEVADKVFADAPIGLKRDIHTLQERYKINTKDVDILTIYKAIDSLKDNGVAVCAVPGKVLFSQSKAGEALRNMLLNNGLKAVIMLPALWSRTLINTNMLLIDKSYNGDVMFVKTDNLGYREKRTTSLSKEDIKTIVHSVNNEVEGISKLVNKQQIVKEATLMPTAYLTNTSKKNVRSVQEIDEELKDLYAELKKNIKE